MKTYADLDLFAIRDECGLYFARHTYSRNQCSCCYGPLDMPAKYWAKGKKPRLIAAAPDKGINTEKSLYRLGFTSTTDFGLISILVHHLASYQVSVRRLMTLLRASFTPSSPISACV